MFEHVNDDAVRVADEESAHSPRLVGQRIHAVIAAPQRLHVHIVNVRDRDRHPGCDPGASVGVTVTCAVGATVMVTTSSVPWQSGLSDWGFGGFGGAVGVGDMEGAVGFHDESDFGVVGGAVVVVFAQQTA
ncbi:MAG TPA: hypothetical protein VM282_23870, partial [Acidimicrobiales bacterium]|nr:hypothetical protein [Acidimicrobiales bacterium]